MPVPETVPATAWQRGSGGTVRLIQCSSLVQYPCLCNKKNRVCVQTIGQLYKLLASSCLYTHGERTPSVTVLAVLRRSHAISKLIPCITASVASDRISERFTSCIRVCCTHLSDRLFSACMFFPFFTSPYIY